VLHFVSACSAATALRSGDTGKALGPVEAQVLRAGKVEEQKCAHVTL